MKCSYSYIPVYPVYPVLNQYSCFRPGGGNSRCPISRVGPSISSVTFDIEDFDIECSFDIDVFTFDIVYRYRRYSISTLFDIEGDILVPSISKVTNRTVDIELSSL